MDGRELCDRENVNKVIADRYERRDDGSGRCFLLPTDDPVKFMSNNITE